MEKNTEAAMYENDNFSTGLAEFLDIIGEKVSLKGFKGFSGGLDIERDTDGPVSYYTDFHSAKIMFHVSPLIRVHEGDPSRKRHVGNDVVVIVFRDEGCIEALDVSDFCSQFNHIFVVVSKATAEELKDLQKNNVRDTDTDWYRVGIATKGVRHFHPCLPNPPLIKKQNLREWLLTKCINGERSALDESTAFSKRIAKTRQEMLQMVVVQHLQSPHKRKKIVVYNVDNRI